MVSQDLENLLALEGSFRGHRAFIIATGPSLAYRDMSFLEHEVTIGLNLSPLLFDQWGFLPTFNIVADKQVYPTFRDIFATLTVGTTTKKIVVAGACETFPPELTDFNTYFIPRRLPQEVIQFSENPLRDGFWRGKTVAYDALQFAFFLGFDNVYILGMDMTVDHQWGTNGHSYEIQQNGRFKNFAFPDTQSQMIQRGFPGQPSYRALIEAYMEKAREHFEGAGRQVINDSRSSLTVFPQEDVLKKWGYVPKVVAFVPAKGTSTRVENKNVRLLGEKPLFLHILDTLLSCHTIDEVYLDSESDTIFSLAEGRNHIILRRPVELASNGTDGNALLRYEASQVPHADIYVQALPTAPFLSRDTIDRAVYELIRNPTPDSIFAALRQKCYLWQPDGTPQNYDPRQIPNSFDLPDTIIEAMSLYVIRRESLMAKGGRIGERPVIFGISPLEAIDINTHEDFTLAEVVCRGLEEK